MNQLFARLKALHRQHDLVLGRAVADNMKRVQWIFLTLVPLYAAGLMHSWGPVLGVDVLKAASMRAMGWLDVVMLAWLLTSMALFYGLRLGQHATPVKRLFMGIATFVFLAYGVLATWILNGQQPTVTLYVLACVFVGALVLERPSVMFVMFFLSYVALVLSLGQVPMTALMLRTELLHGSIAAMLGFVLSLTSWRRFSVTELLRDQVAAQNQDLRQRNAELAQQKAEFEQLSQHDGLTGLLNRRAFTQQAQLLWQRAARDGSTLAAVMLDLDFFKRINDQFGHPAGDAVIIHMAQIIRTSVRETDLAARVGGEEFMLALPNSSTDNAVLVAEKIRHQLTQAPLVLPDGQQVSMTVSAGVVACQPDQTANFEALYSAADRALYQAKQSGRNCVKVAIML
ncbi:diguanylate cyclase [Rhodoferax sp.]|uniref:GGDEF domain-containing protein n=1 Tax=Rhodoferax sp. TaxID=50421 RepID=UPI002619FAC8|nr:diguanylate cyclase [Rhodoferax sp.]MDD5479076.1 diguanylate cyclase [Rhodoferax sp.]